MDIWEGLIVVLVTFLSSSMGFLAHLKNRLQVSDEDRKVMISLLMGLSQIAIIQIGTRHLERGWITTEDFDDIRRYLYDPYMKLGGNGTVERIFRAIERLPFEEVDRPPKESIIREIPIRETDETGLPNDKTYEGEERRGRGRSR